ncbi:hypothetical protein X975_09049, partial [Stegodyphus mimosarum]
MIKNFSTKFVSSIELLNNFMSLHCYFSESWKHALVIPVPNLGQCHSNPQNYRPISLSSSLPKIYEFI